MSLFPKVGRKQPGLRVTWTIVVAILVFGLIMHLIPFYFMIITSLKSAPEIMRMPPTLFPQEPTLNAWRLVFEVTTQNDLLRQPLYVYFVNSCIMAFGTLLLSLPITAFAAYANSKLQNGRGARYTFLFFIGTLMVPGAVTLIPTFLLTRNFPFPLPQVPLIPGTETQFPYIRIWNTALAVIIPGVFNAFNFLLFKGFFDTIPNSIIQAARVDGGSEFNIFRRIVLPMSIPVFAVAAYLQFSGVWDSFLWPLLVIQDSTRSPMSVAIYNLVNVFSSSGATSPQASLATNERIRMLQEAGLSWNGLVVLGILQTLPIFLMFLVSRNYLLKGVKIRGLK
ncbi:MAG: carbohydrate ABC transporter permease [Anaerolinea sp.]|nr:carbohydrate ABC transporter permease [Anaerolinea sp.]